MTVTDIIEISKKQCKIMIDSEFAFVLYKGELHLYGIAKEKPISEETYRQIIDEVLTKRCKLRAMNLLQARPYSEKKLRDKLTAGRYPASCIDSAIEYVRSYGYINDLQYASDYMFYHGRSMNRMQIFTKLRQRGIPEDLIQKAYLDFCDSENVVSEEELIHKFLVKKHIDNFESYDSKEKAKIFRMLMQKGFSYDSSVRALRSYVAVS